MALQVRVVVGTAAGSNPAWPRRAAVYVICTRLASGRPALHRQSNMTHLTLCDFLFARQGGEAEGL